MAEQPGAPFAAFVGAMLEEKSPGYSRLFLKTGPQHADAAGRVHTGALTSIMDSAIGIALARLRGVRRSRGPAALRQRADREGSSDLRRSGGSELVRRGGFPTGE